MSEIEQIEAQMVENRKRIDKAKSERNYPVENMYVMYQFELLNRYLHLAKKSTGNNECEIFND